MSTKTPEPGTFVPMPYPGSFQYVNVNQPPKAEKLLEAISSVLDQEIIDSLVDSKIGDFRMRLVARLWSALKKELGE